MSFKEIKTQEELDAVIADRLNRQKEMLLKNFSDYEDIKSENNALKEEIANLKNSTQEFLTKEETDKQTINDLNKKIQRYELNEIKTKIALENNLPITIASRLYGTDRESITKDAKELALFFNMNGILPMKSVENHNIDDKDASYKKLLENL